MQGSNLRPLPCELAFFKPQSRKSTRYALGLRASVTRMVRNGQGGTGARHVLVTVVVTGVTPHHPREKGEGRREHAGVVRLPGV